MLRSSSMKPRRESAAPNWGAKQQGDRSHAAQPTLICPLGVCSAPSAVLLEACVLPLKVGLCRRQPAHQQAGLHGPRVAVPAASDRALPACTSSRLDRGFYPGGETPSRWEARHATRRFGPLRSRYLAGLSGPRGAWRGVSW